MKPDILPNLFEYGDFRRFLRDCYTQRKKVDPTYSYKRLADAAGLGSPNYPKLVIDGERSLTVSNIHRFAQALRLTPSETSYFETLVHLNQSETSLEKSFYQARLADLKKRAAPSSMLIRNSSSTALLQSPVAMAVVVAVHELSEEDAIRRVQQKTGIKKDTIALVIEILLKENLLRVIDGRYELTERYIQFQDRQSKSSNQKKYIRAQLEESLKALETRYARDAKFYCNTFTIAEGSLPNLQEKIGKLVDELMEETNNESPDRVMQLNVQLFPTIQKA